PKRSEIEGSSAAPADADLSSTLFAVGALRVAGAGEDDPAVRAALVFVERCQNFAAGRDADPAFDDGGFFFSPTDPVRNKALAVRELDLGDRKIAWAELLAWELIERQRPDGTWVNPYTASKEDDPLVATSFAAGALGNCRAVMGPAR